ncbi:MAG: hypothetical protein R3275_02060 [Saprospiraceae bacterium]|nr:hypothetical protein [Saprospiraceae bacterium]
MKTVAAERHIKLLDMLDELSGSGIRKQRATSKVLSLIDLMSRDEEGLKQLYDHIEKVVEAGIFQGTSWEEPAKLVPTLVKGTLMSGFPMIIYESLSELRMLKIAQGEWVTDDISRQEAQEFLHEAVISSFGLVFHGGSEEARSKLTRNERKRLKLLFDFILSRISLRSLLDRLANEIEVIAEQRPIQTERVEDLIELVRDNIELKGEQESEVKIQFYIDALYQPTERTKEYWKFQTYQGFLDQASIEELRKEAVLIGHKMNETGLVSKFHVALVRTLAKRAPDFLSDALFLDSHGKADLERHQKFIVDTILNFILEDNRQAVYGLSKLINRNLLSRKAVFNALNKLFSIRLDSEIERRLKKNQSQNARISPKQLLCGGVIQILGQPLGIGQGLNPTCQSARGISMWSRHSPEKLINMIINAAAANEMSFRYEGELITSNPHVDEQTFDYNLDPVSVVLVPHLDNVYQQMMQKAQFRHPGQDPHVSVNPAFYGHWIQTGFISCYNPLTNMIQNYQKFVELFYASFHPEFNGGFKLIYPIPLGIFITTAQAEFLGFHAVSLLRVKQGPDGDWRAYFFNPNNEGRQNWGQDIVPTVVGNGERHGESSLPFDEFTSRVYAFHYNSLEAGTLVENIEVKDFPKVRELAKESWGKQYFWD